MIRLVIVDDHPIVLSGLEQLFSFEKDLQVVATCTSGEEAMVAMKRFSPDIMLVDLKMKGMSGLDVLREVAASPSPCRVIFLTAAIDEDDVVEAMKLGIDGVILKEMAPRLLVQCVRKVAAGEQWLEKSSVGRALDKMIRREEAMQEIRSILTDREIEVTRFAARGLRNKEIADRMNIGEGTVKVHLHTIYDKLKVSGRVELTLYAQKLGLA